MYTDFFTAAKARKNRGVILGASDNPQLAKPEFEKAMQFFNMTNNKEAVEKTKELLKQQRRFLPAKGMPVPAWPI